MKLKKFLEREARRSNSTVAHLLEHHEVTRCECGKRKCKGWAVRYKLRAERRREAAT